MNPKPTLVAGAARHVVITGAGAAQPVKRTRYQEMLIDAICGVGFPSTDLAMEAEGHGLADCSLIDAERPAWNWDRLTLQQMSEQELLRWYAKLKVAQGVDL